MGCCLRVRQQALHNTEGENSLVNMESEIADVVLFPNQGQADDFISKLARAIAKRHDPDPNTSTFQVTVRICIMDSNDIRRYAQEVKSEPYPGAAAIFLYSG